jgi:hypothetical protein
MRFLSCSVLLSLLACQGAAWDRTAVPPPMVAQRVGGKVAQYCTFNGSSDLDTINEFLRRQGEEGWELVALGGQTGTVYCFRQATRSE